MILLFWLPARDARWRSVLVPAPVTFGVRRTGANHAAPKNDGARPALGTLCNRWGWDIHAA